MNGRTLVVYYSYEGNTKYIAEAIAHELGADIERLRPVSDITTKGIRKYLWGGRQVLMKKMPELEPLEHVPDDYDLLFIGTPVWASSFAPALRSFFAKYAPSGKRIALFCTHQGGPGKTLAKMEKALEGNTVIGTLDLINVLRDEPEMKRARAVEWARKLAGRDNAGR